ncbi:MAG: PTS sugar transporter subunit IIB [Elusimicrobia bacterium]|nr:PTS sugar transporter subunit IIB [Elusimicrobiota bacterium]MDE2236299.1 PTS sugar transporter subunit IIB [Elusimicrobiota bacterium]MDE2424406.1 PTS sugar transporter subunit IIB [Elusimicrobiota bacterium]
MPLSLVRIDDRLVHGQVVEGWIPRLKIEQVLVACDAAAKDDLQASLMRLALPEKIGLDVLGVAQAARHPGFQPGYLKRLLVLVPGPREILELLDGGAAFSTVNVGGLHYTAGKVQLGKAIFLSEEDRTALREILRRGVALEGRALPSDKPLDILALVDAGGGAS